MAPRSIDRWAAVEWAPGTAATSTPQAAAAARRQRTAPRTAGSEIVTGAPLASKTASVAAWRQDRPVVSARPWCRDQVGVGAQHDLIDPRTVLALLDADHVTARRLEVDVRAERSPSVVGPAPAMQGAAGRTVLKNGLE